MKPVQTLLLSLLTLGRVVAQGQPANDSNAELRAANLEHLRPLQRDVVEAFDKIAAERGVTAAEVRRVFAEMNCNGQAFTKGGAGLIRDDVFVVVNSEKNEMVAGGDTAVGADCQTPELFVFAGGRFVGRMPLPSDSAANVIVALFSPEKVRYYDWEDFEGGYFKRWRENKPNKPVETTVPAVTPPARQESSRP